MGNYDGMMEASLVEGNNEKAYFKGGYFSFAFDDEIALVIDNDYYILNVGENIFNTIKEKISNGANKKELIMFWKELSKKEYVYISEWSNNFNNLIDDD